MEGHKTSWGLQAVGRHASQAAVLSLTLAGHALVGLGPLATNVLPWRFADTPTYNFWRVDTSAGEPVITPNWTETRAERVRTDWLFELPTFLFLPLCVVAALRGRPRHYVMASLIVSVVYAASDLAAEIASDSLPQSGSLLLTMSSFLAAFAVPWFPGLARGSAAMSMCFFQLLAMLMGFSFLMFLNTTDGSNQLSQIILVCGVIPVTREITYGLARKSCEHFTKSALAAGERSPAVWPLFLWPQILFSTLSRVFIANIEDFGVMVLVVGFQSILEVTMRLSLAQRHRLVRSVAGGQLSMRRSRKRVEPASPADSVESLNATAAADEERTRRFLATVLASEMLAEFIAILVVAADLIIFSGAKLQFPSEFYNNMENPFTEAASVSAILTWAGLQLVSELAVDTLCGAVEIARGLDLPRAWRMRHRNFFLVIFASTWFSMILTNVVLGGSDSTSNCEAVDLCFCMPPSETNGTEGGLGGLRPGGLRHRYCLYIYPDTSGLPTHPL